MAETIGVVAATLEFAKIVLEAKQLYSSIRHAPQTLKQLLEELEALEEILETFKEQEAALSAFAPPDVVRKCRQRSEKAVQSLKPICDELSKAIKRSRIRGSVKAVLKEDALDKARQVVERAKADFMLAQMNVLNAMSLLNIRKHSETHTLIMTSTASVSAIVQDIRQASISSTFKALLSHSGDTVQRDTSDAVHSSSWKPRHQQRWVNVRTRRLLLLQSRLLGKAFEFVQQQACGAWTYGFRTYNVRAWNEPVFRYVFDGNIAALQNLFHKGQASILDRSPCGDTLLHIACESEGARTIRFLMQQGLDPNDKDDNGLSCLTNLSLRYEVGTKLEAIQAICEGPELDDLTNSPEVTISNLSSVSSFQALSHVIQLVSPPWSTRELSARLQAAYDACSPRLDSDRFWLCLSQSQLDPACLVRKISEEDAPPVYGSLVVILAAVLADHWIFSLECPDFSGWRTIFQAAVGLDGLRVAIEHDVHSPMLAYLGFYSLERQPSWANLSTQRLTHKLRHWVTEISNAGQDLLQYGKWEHERLVAEGWTFQYSVFCRNDRCSTFRVVDFTYGAGPEDWQIWVSLSSDECVGEFWNLLTDRESKLCIPGAWPETEDWACWVCHPEDTQDPSALGWPFSTSRRRRRRVVRYFDLTKERFDEVYGLKKRRYVAYMTEEGKKRKARRKRFFGEAGIAPPPKLPY
ncbi:hypothetical protein G647_05022 [Cladophialophora carrionii CBS 160.54]|uniref:Uncharacterized protein n=1 Tax=Cladophialophora carrionii CBS 160.54 TaxID=1279043 RepID=V9D8H6_9EURO|nr:uncharacterized protein G647_05022 [Cladophialophora carrionii CBS 160.54]ETI23224.1 hypothetical protein G647_05022 [Cladophialophora carrionii CBS 160.54]